MTDRQIEVWEIAPHQSEAYDTCIIPVAKDPNGDAAVEHAKDALDIRLEDWDMRDEFSLTIRIRKRKMNVEDLPEGVEP
jgi:hypothetical protein